jgi:hypothetical protein
VGGSPHPFFSRAPFDADFLLQGLLEMDRIREEGYVLSRKTEKSCKYILQKNASQITKY